MDLRQVLRRLDVESPGTVFDGIGAVEGQGAPGFECDAGESLGRKPLHGIPVNPDHRRGVSFGHRVALRAQLLYCSPGTMPSFACMRQSYISDGRGAGAIGAVPAD